MSCVFPELPGWVFEIDEVSAGVYKVVAKDQTGSRFSRTGTNVDTLTNECRSEVANIIGKEHFNRAK